MKKILFRDKTDGLGVVEQRGQIRIGNSLHKTSDRSLENLRDVPSSKPNVLEQPIRRRKLIGLKSGGSVLERSDLSQADGYSQGLYEAGVMPDCYFLMAWVIGREVGAGVGGDRFLACYASFGKTLISVQA
ncbi:MAG TPA: hypothetical protein VGD45_04775 [Steroidobacter sp.]|uniref:hypothetical protein n=1 Tax=Steroidobacter sp. TaxID=1978227 RepID=UPI002ED8723D